MGKRLPLILLLLLLVGCASLRTVEKAEAPPPARHEEILPPEDLFRTFPEKYRREAVRWEKSGEFPKALLYWKVVQRFAPHDPEASEKVRHWEAWLQRESENRFLRGLEKLKQNSAEDARKELLAALAFNPDHPQVLDYLKHQLNESVWVFYEVKKGDSPKKISQEVYKDPEKDFLVVYFNSLDSQAPLKPGTMLKLPVLTPVPVARKGSPEAALPKAPAPSKPFDLDVSLQEQAEIHYAKGMRHFLSEELDKAIEQWEETLRINPNHSNAKRDLQRARDLLKKSRKPH